MTQRNLVGANFVYRLDQVEPDMAFTWLDHTGAPFPFDSSWTFELQIVDFSDLSVVKTIPNARITGSAQQANVLVNLEDDQWNGLSAKWYQLHLAAWPTATPARKMLLNEGHWPTVELTPIPT